MNLEDEYSGSSSPSSPCSDNITNNASSPPSPKNVSRAPVSHKRKAGRKKFRETRHPVYNGVRLKNDNKWVCEVREPNKKSRIWLGTFASPESAARAHDVAALALRGERAKLNFPDFAKLLPRAKSSSARDIRMAVREATGAFSSITSFASSSSSSSSLSSLSRENVEEPFVVESTSAESHKGVVDPSAAAIVEDDEEGDVIDENALVDPRTTKVSDSSASVFMDDEELFNMPGLLDSMAEGLLLTPPAMKRGFNWDDIGYDTDMTLWRD